jgi:hypothetical protein
VFGKVVDGIGDRWVSAVLALLDLGQPGCFQATGLGRCRRRWQAGPPGIDGLRDPPAPAAHTAPETPATGQGASADRDGRSAHPPPEPA